jgi:hypothetical protein
MSGLSLLDVAAWPRLRTSQPARKTPRTTLGLRRNLFDLWPLQKSLWHNLALARHGATGNLAKTGCRHEGIGLADTPAMATKRRIDHLKMPFVVTVTMANACGGTVISHGEGEGNGGSTGGAAASGGSGAGASGGKAAGGTSATNTGGWSTGGVVVGGSGPIGGGGIVNPPFPGTCPPSAPSQGTYCDLPVSTSCPYPGSSSCVPSVNASCLGGQWQVSNSYIPCNPPPPPTTECPVAEPAPGSPCSYVGPECGYRDCYGVPSFSAQCTSNFWLTTVGTCNPPPSFPEAGPWDAGSEPSDGG